MTIEEEDKKKRSEMAHAIVDVMTNLMPHQQDNIDVQHKIWDQLFMMSSYRLEVDSPFQKPTPEEMQKKPEPLAYPENNPKYRFYGNNIKKMIDEVKDWADDDKKEALILAIANHMKKSYLNWNRDTVDDKIIFDHLFELSDGKINLNKADEDLSAAADLINTNAAPVKKYKGRKRKYHNKNRKKH